MSDFKLLQINLSLVCIVEDYGAFWQNAMHYGRVLFGQLTCNRGHCHVTWKTYWGLFIEGDRLSGVWTRWIIL